VKTSQPLPVILDEDELIHVSRLLRIADNGKGRPPEIIRCVYCLRAVNVRKHLRAAFGWRTAPYVVCKQCLELENDNGRTYYPIQARETYERKLQEILHGGNHG
jgi:hypothetical protein